MKYKREGKVLLSSLNRARWSLAYHALKGKQDKIESWAAILADLARVEERTVREWAQAAEFRDEVGRVFGGYIDLPYSFYARASRKLDALKIETIIELMLTFQVDKSAKISEFDSQLNALAGPELPDYGGFPPSGYPLADIIRDEISKLKELSVRPDVPAYIGKWVEVAYRTLDKVLAMLESEAKANA
jgi:hypothetical protein